jgi:hypothetical protein
MEAQQVLALLQRLMVVAAVVKKTWVVVAAEVGTATISTLTRHTEEVVGNKERHCGVELVRHRS